MELAKILKTGPVGAVLLCLVLLTACGGNSGDNFGSSTQSKRLVRSEKSVSTNYAPLVQQLYVAYFGRPADPNGLNNFENALAAINAPTTIQELSAAYATNPAVKALIDTFDQSAESQSLYGAATTSAFVNAVYHYVLGRAPASAGLNFWVSAIDSNQLSKGDAALSIMAGALSNNTKQGQLDAQLINNRLGVAAYFTSQVWLQHAESYYAGSAAAASARGMLSVVNAYTPPSYSYAVITDEIYEAMLPACTYVGTYTGNTTGTYPVVFH